MFISFTFILNIKLLIMQQVVILFKKPFHNELHSSQQTPLINEIKKLYLHSLSKVALLQLRSTQFKNVVGLLKSVWFDADDSLMCINHGTAFAVAPKIIVTCGNNVYLEKNGGKGKYAHVVEFYPGSDCRITSRSKMYTSHRNKQTWKTTEPIQSFSSKPLPEELTLIELQEQIEEDFFIKVGNQFDENSQYPLQIIGYPSREYKDKFNIQKAIISRTKLDGQLFRIYGSTLQYTMNTAVGFAGSPIFGVSEDNETICIGIHTHKGFLPGINSGLFFSRSILNKTRYFEEQIKYNKPSYLYNIEYSEKALPQLQEYDQTNSEQSEIEITVEESSGEQLSQTSQVFSQEYAKDQAKEELNQFQLDQMEKIIPQQQQRQVLNQGHCASDYQMQNIHFSYIQKQQAKEDQREREHNQLEIDKEEPQNSISKSQSQDGETKSKTSPQN